MFVLICTEGGTSSEAVADEIIEFKKTGRLIIPIDFDGAARRANWWSEIEGLYLSTQTAALLTNPVIDEAIITRIKTAFTFARKDQRQRKANRVALGVLTASLAITIVASAFAVTETAKVVDALNQLKLASDQKRDAERSLSETKQTLAKLNGDLQTTKEQLQTTGTKLTNTTRDLTNANNDLATARKETIKQIALAEKATKEAKRGSVRFYEERGRQSLLNGNPEGAMVYLNQAYQLNREGPELGNDVRPESLSFLLSWTDRYLAGRVASLNGHENRVTWGQFSPDMARVITVSDDGSAKVWSSTTGQLLGTLSAEDHDNPTMLEAQFSPDGKRIMTTVRYVKRDEDNEDRPRQRIVASLWNGTTYEPIPTADEYSLEDDADDAIIKSRSWPRPCFSADSTRFDLTVTDGPTEDKVFSSTDGTEISDGIKACTPTPKQTRGAWERGTSEVTIKNAVTGTTSQYDTHEPNIEKVVFSPKLTRFVTISKVVTNAETSATASDQVAKLWDGTTGRAIATLSGHTASITDVVFSPDGEVVVTVSRDRTCRVWSAQNGIALTTLKGHNDAVLSAAFSSDSQRLLTFGEDNRAIIWAWRNMKVPLRALPDIGGRAVVFSVDGSRLITTGLSRMASWNIDSATAPAIINLPPGEQAVALSPLGDRVVTRGVGDTLKLFDLKTGTRIGSFLIKRAADVAFSSNGKYLVVSFWREWNVVNSIGIQVWDAESGEPKRSSSDESTGYIDALGDAEVAGSIAVNSDGTRVFGYNWETGEIWTSRFDTWDPNYAWAGKHKGVVTLAVFSPNDKYLVTASDDKTVKIWIEAVSQKNHQAFLKLVHTLGGHTGEITSIKFSRDGKWIVTTSVDGSAKVWDVETGNLYASCDGHKGRVNAADFSADAQRLVTVADDGLIRVWDSETGDLLAAIEAHNGAATSVAYNSENNLVASTGADGAVRVLDLAFSSPEASALSERVERLTSLQISKDQLVPATVRRVRQSASTTRPYK